MLFLLLNAFFLTFLLVSSRHMASQFASIVELLVAEPAKVDLVGVVSCLELDALFHQVLAGLNSK